MLIGITGTDGAGKGAVVSYLVEKKGFVHYSARAILEEEFKRRGIESNRVNMRFLANELRAKHGNDYVVSYFLKKIAEEKPKDAVIESIRATAEVETLKANDGVLLAVDADRLLRYERITGRRSSSDKVTFDEFVAHEELEMNDPDPNGMQKAEVIKMADHTIMNDGTMEELRVQIEEFLTSFV